MIEIHLHDPANPNFCPNLFCPSAGFNPDDQVFSDELLEWMDDKKIWFGYRIKNGAFTMIKPRELTVAIFNSSRTADDVLIFEDHSDAIMFKLTWV